MKNKKIKIEIFFPINKRIVSRFKIINDGTTLKEFLDKIELEELHSLANLSFGVFGKTKDLDYKLKEFDRIEVYHDASADPKKSRELRVKKNHKS